MWGQAEQCSAVSRVAGDLTVIVSVLLILYFRERKVIFFLLWAENRWSDRPEVAGHLSCAVSPAVCVTIFYCCIVFSLGGLKIGGKIQLWGYESAPSICPVLLDIQAVTPLRCKFIAIYTGRIRPQSFLYEGSFGLELKRSFCFSVIEIGQVKTKTFKGENKGKRYQTFTSVYRQLPGSALVVHACRSFPVQPHTHTHTHTHARTHAHTHTHTHTSNMLTSSFASKGSGVIKNWLHCCRVTITNRNDYCNYDWQT